MSKVGMEREFRAGALDEASNEKSEKSKAQEKPVREKRWQKKRKKDDQIPGQYSFIARGTELVIDNTEQLEYESRLRKSIVEYYEQYLETLSRYGKHNKFYGPWLSLTSEKPSAEAKAFLRYHMNNDLDTLEDRLQKAMYWLKKSLEKLVEAGTKVGVKVSAYYDEAYRDSKRREAFRGYIKREMANVLAEKTLDVYSPKDFEDRFQMNRAKNSRKKAQKNESKDSGS